MEEKNLKLLAITQKGWEYWTTNRLIRKPSDFDGFRIRVMVSPLLVEAYKAYGASAVPLPYGEVYGALQLGMIDGQVNPFEGILDMKFYDFADYMINGGTLNYISTLYCNLQFYNNLPKEIKKMLDETIAEMSDWSFKLQNDMNEERYKKITAAKPSLKVITLNAEEISAFKEKTKPVKQKFLEIGGKGAKQILDEVEKEMKGF
jgi:TRAP-type C4-dicarboxylate transport system substrate-binding protein